MPNVCLHYEIPIPNSVIDWSTEVNIVVFQWFIACSEPQLFQTIDLVNDDYAIETRRIDTLTNPDTMEGDLGTLYVGGIFEIDWTTGNLTYAQGRPLQINYQAIDGVAHPIDRDGLIAFSYYAHLEDTVEFLTQIESEWNGLLPVDTAISPLISDLSLAFLPMENAAYVPTLHHFLLLTDAIPKDVPLAANKGVVAHEFGHAIFHYLTTGSTTNERLLPIDAKGFNSVYSLDEGLADVLGYLVTGRADFIADSLTDQDRALDGEHLAIEVETLPADHTDDGLLSAYDPYDLGSVFAATIWEVADTINDPIRMFNWIVESTTTFGQDILQESREDDVNLGMQWLDIWVDTAPSTNESVLACSAIASRWTDVYEVAACLE